LASIDITAYYGQLIRIGFQHNEPQDYSDRGWYFDDVTIVLPAPIISSFSPTQGGIGSRVTITGNFFDGTSTVTFNGKSASFVVNSHTEITAIVPVGATTGLITVTTPSGMATSSKKFVIVPTANLQTVSVAHNSTKAITLTGSDPYKLALRFAIATPPIHGTLGALNTTTGAVTYTPSSNFGGTYSFTFTVADGTYTSVPGTVTLKVAGGTPTANAQTISVNSGVAKAIKLTGTDSDSPPLPLKFAITAAPGNGTLSGLNTTTGAVIYSPSANYQGTDSFGFEVSNGSVTSSPATVTLKVAPGTPTSKAQTVLVGHGAATTITLAGTDPDNPPLALTYAIAAQPANGTLSGLNSSTGAVTYTPNANFQGIDTFTFTVNNGTNTSAAATVTLMVAPGTPTANAQILTVALNKAVKITLTGSDPDVPALKLTFAITTRTAHGILGSLNTQTGVLVYTPDTNYKGADSFTFTVSNGTNKSVPATVTLNVGG
jgi:hypothetical protein